MKDLFDIPAAPKKPPAAAAAKPRNVCEACGRFTGLGFGLILKGETQRWACADHFDQVRATPAAARGAL